MGEGISRSFESLERCACCFSWFSFEDSGRVFQCSFRLIGGDCEVLGLGGDPTDFRGFFCGLSDAFGELVWPLARACVLVSGIRSWEYLNDSRAN